MATIAASRAGDLLHAGAGELVALDRGFQLAFATAIAFPILGLIVSVFLLTGFGRAASTESLKPATSTASAE